MPDSSHGSACPVVFPDSPRALCANRDQKAAGDRCRRPFAPASSRTYRGCSPTVRRRGVIRTTPRAEVLAFRRGCRLSGQDMPAPSVFVGLELDTNSYTGVPCWSAGPAHWAHNTVAVAYDLRYQQIRSLMCDGGIARKTLIVIAAAWHVTPTGAPAATAGPPTTSSKPRQASTSAPSSGPTNAYAYSGWLPRCCAAANAPTSSAWPPGEWAIATAAGRPCGHYTTTARSHGLSTACHPTWNGPQ